MKIILATCFIMLLVVLTGCSGDVASPTHNEYDSHAVTTTTTTTTTNEQEMPQVQVGNHPVCTGLVIINCGNTIQTGSQSSGIAAKTAPKPVEKKQDAPITFELICGQFLVAVGIVFWFLVALWCLKKIFGPAGEGTF